MNKEILAKLPQIETLLQEPEIKLWSVKLGRPVTADIARKAVDEIRRSVLAEEGPLPSLSEIVSAVVRGCRFTEQEQLQRVVNATGIIIHTNMGRSPLLRDVWRDAEEINCGYSNLELDLANGKRGKRKGVVPRLLSKLIGAEDALIVNNNAAAVYLILKTFAENREVVVSRGEQVQIGGGFRIPEILGSSGARLVETGTTNITTADDYHAAFTEETAMILSVHRSNFAIRGFASSPSTAELARIRPEGVLLCVDQGSGILDENLPGEVTVRSHIKNGADLVCFSGDKVLGGPQAGIIVGRKELISTLEKHPMMRVFRPGKTVYSLLESTLVRRLNGISTIISRTLSMTEDELKDRGEKILKGLNRDKLSIVESTITTGGGSLPDESFPSLSIRIDTDRQPDRLLKTLRDASPPIIGYISNDRVHFNLATIQLSDIPHINAVFRQLQGE